MKKLLLIHWYTFNHEVIEFDKLNFLTGKNASGKSTIIDALQIIFLADTSGNFFNKSAGAKSDRTLAGYLQGEVIGDGENGIDLLRSGRFTSYIAVEFYDDQRKRSFAVGCCFDFYSENDIQKQFFFFDECIPSNDFIVESTPMDIKTLKRYINDNYKGVKSSVNLNQRDFRLYLNGIMGALQERFQELFKKAVPFNPIVDIQQFVSDFVCDEPKRPEVGILQENIDYYKKLEDETKELEQRLRLLNEIVETYERYSKFSEQELLYSYIIDRAKLQVFLDRKQSLENELSNKLKELDRLATEKAIQTENKANYSHRRDEITVALSTNEVSKEIERLERLKKQYEEAISQVELKYKSSMKLLHENLLNWKFKIKTFKDKISIIGCDFLEHFESAKINGLIDDSGAFINQISFYDPMDDSTILNGGLEKISDLSKKARSISERSFAFRSNINDWQFKISEEHSKLIKQKENLKKGINSFPDYVTRFRDILHTEIGRTNKQFKADILSEIIEIKDERWRNSIEGYLNAQKFYILVEPKDFQTALRIYNRVKDEQKINSVGLVDVEKVVAKNPVPDKGSLAEEIITDNRYARSYINYLLGKVIKCNSVDELRKFSTSITDEGMLYQGFVARRINPKLWERPTIGQGAVSKQLVSIESDISETLRKNNSYAMIKDAISEVCALTYMSENDNVQVIDSTKAHSELDSSRDNLQDIDTKLKNIDMSSIKNLENEKITVEAKIKKCDDTIEFISKEKGALENRCEFIDETCIPEVNADTESAQAIVDTNYLSDWVEATGYPRYEKALFAKSPSEIEQNFKANLTKAINGKTDEWKNLRDLRGKYNHLCNAGYDVDNLQNDVYDDAWITLSDIKLPEYKIKISDAKEKAYERFREDFLSRLQYNIKDAENQIEKLNYAIKGHYFGDEMYRFQVFPKPENKRFYDMITDSMLLRGYNLMTNEYNAKYENELNELFSLITEKGEDYERRIDEYTNYRTYLSFDLELSDRDGKKQRLSKTLGKKSGGETQTPFYVAVLASFAQIYRIGRDKSENTIKLIIFDEAFSKMDGDRIVKSIELLKKFNFQVILGSPPDKVPEISPLVDKTICVIKENYHTCITTFGKDEVGEYYDTEKL